MGDIDYDIPSILIVSLFHNHVLSYGKIHTSLEVLSHTTHLLKPGDNDGLTLTQLGFRLSLLPPT